VLDAVPVVGPLRDIERRIRVSRSLRPQLRGGLRRSERSGHERAQFAAGELFVHESILPCLIEQVEPARLSGSYAGRPRACLIQGETILANSLVAISEQIASTVEQVAQSVVSVHARHPFESSGVHWSPEIVVTADHALRRDEGIRVTAPDGSKLDAEVVGRDPGTDLAVLRVKGLGTPVVTKDENPSTIPGSIVLAVGRSKDSAVAAFGVISNISGPSQTWRGGRLDQVVRLDLSLHPAGAGGAIVGAPGKLIGIATPALSRVSVFAIPLSTVTRVTDSLLAHGRVPRGYLGVGLQPIAIPEHLRSKLNLASSTGLIAISVENQGPAGQAGMSIGDVLVELGGRVTQRTENVQEVLSSEAVGKKIEARIMRGGNLVELPITIAERPRRG
jgi:S1-C subfamily serine protease